METWENAPFLRDPEPVDSGVSNCRNLRGLSSSLRKLASQAAPPQDKTAASKNAPTLLGLSCPKLDQVMTQQLLTLHLEVCRLLRTEERRRTVPSYCPGRVLEHDISGVLPHQRRGRMAASTLHRQANDWQEARLPGRQAQTSGEPVSPRLSRCRRCSKPCTAGYNCCSMPTFYRRLRACPTVSPLRPTVLFVTNAAVSTEFQKQTESAKPQLPPRPSV